MLVKNRIIHTLLHSTHAPVKEFPSRYCHTVLYEKKTRMVWLPNGKKVWWQVQPFRQNTGV